METEKQRGMDEVIINNKAEMRRVEMDWKNKSNGKHG